MGNYTRDQEGFIKFNKKPIPEEQSQPQASTKDDSCNYVITTKSFRDDGTEYLVVYNTKKTVDSNNRVIFYTEPNAINTLDAETDLCPFVTLGRSDAEILCKLLNQIIDEHYDGDDTMLPVYDGKPSGLSFERLVDRIEGFRYSNYMIKEKLEVVTIFDQPALFTPIRIKSAYVPKCLYKYEMRNDDTGEPCGVAKSIFVDHYGTLITANPIPDVQDEREMSFNDIVFGVGQMDVMAFYEKYKEPFINTQK